MTDKPVASTMQWTKENRMIWSWGEAFDELKDHPLFLRYQQMVGEIIKSLQDSIDSGSPEDFPEVDYNQVIAARVNQVKGLKNLKDIQEQYHNFYLKHKDQQQEDEDDYTREVGSSGSRKTKRTRK